MPEMKTSHWTTTRLPGCSSTWRYLGWLSDPEARKWIVAAAEAQRMADLKGYVVQRVGRADVLFLGIFDNVFYETLGRIHEDFWESFKV